MTRKERYNINDRKKRKVVHIEEGQDSWLDRHARSNGFPSVSEFTRHIISLGIQEFVRQANAKPKT